MAAPAVVSPGLANHSGQQQRSSPCCCCHADLKHETGCNDGPHQDVAMQDRGTQHDH
eukprot:CAMPEP_0202414612 /NCGR_PEP_ID=MMETSP1128-20130828/33370_1 /ASSEMBLY_ACC=CAM_ASM_000463 /TAXON_ID=3047 /ORGANISM="Dunaliella tertiolecta, Strain CCMP1320" /LENGTH=56 /DNA_ID=CAMNT_0049021079 /DNA_START=577 /DNA_END=747 /DNA_ORIENTATION=+